MQYEQLASLPTPDELSAAHSASVVDYLRSKIAASDGRISFAEFMHEALYAPGLGNYSAGSTKFGADGDFITAPEVSSVFGKVVGDVDASVDTTRYCTAAHFLVQCHGIKPKGDSC